MKIGNRAFVFAVATMATISACDRTPTAASRAAPPVFRGDEGGGLMGSGNRSCPENCPPPDSTHP